MKNIKVILSIILISTVISTGYSAEILCKNKGHKIDLLNNVNPRKCLDQLRWGAVCFTGNIEVAQSAFMDLFPLSTLDHENSIISYTVTDTYKDISEELYIKKCTPQFLK